MLPVVFRLYLDSAVGAPDVSPARKGWVEKEATIGSTVGAAQNLYCSRRVG